MTVWILRDIAMKDLSESDRLSRLRLAQVELCHMPNILQLKRHFLGRLSKTRLFRSDRM